MEALENATVGELPNCWQTPPKCIINTAECLEMVKSYEQFIRKMDFWMTPRNYSSLKENGVSLLSGQDYTQNLSLGKYAVIRSLMFLGVKP